MKKATSYLLLFLFSISSFACNSEKAARVENPTDKASINSESKIEVFYFHYSRRCATCNAVESVTKEALNQYFAKEVKNKQITFTSIDLDDEANKSLATKYEISGQTLLFVEGKKQVNLTKEGFLYARTSPEKLKVKVQSTVKALLK